MNFWSQKLAWTYYQCLEFAITAHFNNSFFLTLALWTRVCVHGNIGSSMIESQSQPNQNVSLILIKIQSELDQNSGIL